ncbi:hypothetical protein L5515_008912 [Caenorhabditis briggsae]|uniref:Uncharacterized protein n=1 Tax=Caenorhabditis briggsae TaxID=6238 RepID=A0AAE9FBM6_CAEBR|nr:hypothetical protein L5515_008912 [Caenorhabditis briggsae]
MEPKKSSSNTMGSNESFSFSEFHARHAPVDTFTGFSDKYNFTVSCLMMLTFGVGLSILSIIPCWTSSAISVVWTIAFYRWLGIHGQKMTRNEIVFFEAANLLEVDPPVFRFGLPEIADDCLTPGDGEQREHPQPQTLWDALFTDEKKMRMDRFYKKHYGSVHATASKALMEYELEQAKEKEKQLKKVPPPLPTTSTSKSL